MNDKHPLIDYPALQEFLTAMPNNWVKFESALSLRFCRQLYKFGYLRKMHTPIYREVKETETVVHWRKIEETLF